VAWLCNATYREGEGIIIIRFDKSLKPYLLQLKSHFTRYQLNTVIKFKSQYSIRLYELLKEFEFLGHGGEFYRIIEMDDLKGFFGVKQGEYGKTHDLKKRLIDPAVQEVSLYSDISITQVEYIKDGRTVGSVKFTAEPKAQEAIQMDDGIQSLKPKEKKQPGHITALLSFGIAEPLAKKWAKQYGQKKIMAACGYVRGKHEAGEVKDVPAYLSKTLEHDYHLAWMTDQDKNTVKQSGATTPKKQSSKPVPLDADRAKTAALVIEFLTHNEAYNRRYPDTPYDLAWHCEGIRNEFMAEFKEWRNA
jgi:hypothetical protein